MGDGTLSDFLTIFQHQDLAANGKTFVQFVAHKQHGDMLLTKLTNDTNQVINLLFVSDVVGSSMITSLALVAMARAIATSCRCAIGSTSTVVNKNARWKVTPPPLMPL